MAHGQVESQLRRSAILSVPATTVGDNDDENVENVLHHQALQSFHAGLRTVSVIISTSVACIAASRRTQDSVTAKLALPRSCTMSPAPFLDAYLTEKILAFVDPEELVTASQVCRCAGFWGSAERGPGACPTAS